MNIRPVRSALACSIALFASAIVHAESIRVYQAGEVPDPRVVARILGAKPAAFAGLPKTRSLFYTPDEKAPVEPEIKDAGHTVTEDDIAANASAAVAAWHQKLGRASGRNERMGAMQKVAYAQPAGSESVRSDALPPPAAASKRATAGEPGTAAAARPGNPEAGATRPASKKPDSLALSINFSSNSTQLTAESRRAIDSIAEGIKLAGTEKVVLVEGHTNATGSDAHNLKLSRLRAEAVKRYLIARHGIPESALETKGLGSAKPLPGLHPNSAYNRRVQFRALA